MVRLWSRPVTNDLLPYGLTTITYAYGITGMRELVSVETSGAAARWTGLR